MRLPALPSTLVAVLAVWGAFSLALVAAHAGLLVHALAVGATPRVDFASTNDVRFVLNWSELGDHRIAEVVHSYRSKHPLLADHLEAYAIRVTEVHEYELDGSMLAEWPRRRWSRGDRLDTLTADALDFAVPAHEIPWFPTATALKTERYFVYRHAVELHDGVDAAALVFVRLSDRMVYYVSYRV